MGMDLTIYYSPTTTIIINLLEMFIRKMTRVGAERFIVFLLLFTTVFSQFVLNLIGQNSLRNTFCFS